MKEDQIQYIFNQFQHKGEFLSHQELLSGHINDTFFIETNQDSNYVLQRINHLVFKNVPKLIHNKILISKHLQSKSDRTILEFVCIKNSDQYYIIQDNNFWNLMRFIENSKVYAVVPNDTVGIAGAIEQAIEAGIKVASSLFPIGPDLTTLEPQVAGLTATAAGSPVYGATLQANEVVKYCADKNPCNTIIMIGQKIYPFDKLRYDTFLEILGKESNINIVATVEGNYSPDVSLTGMTDALQSAKDALVSSRNLFNNLISIFLINLLIQIYSSSHKQKTPRIWDFLLRKDKSILIISSFWFA